MQAASNGFYRPDGRFQYPAQKEDYSDAGKSTRNIDGPTLARRYLAESGYRASR